jgi:hypothetical protein
MDGKIATLAGAAALAAVPALAGATPQASETAVPAAASYAELLSPIGNASERLQRADAQLDAQAEAAQPQLIEAQYVAHHHHHHHHNHYNRSWYMAHGYYWSGGRWIIRPRHHHHHHHNHY